MSDFSKYLIKDYTYWHVAVHPNQGYLGRCVIWCKREDALDLADATSEEREELFIILQKLREASKKAFQPDWFNYAFLGNETCHLHSHFIPRYSSPRQFNDMEFFDKEWGHNWQSDSSFVSIPELWGAVRSELLKFLQ